MSVTFHHGCTRLPVTALAWTDCFLIAAEGPWIYFYAKEDFRYLETHRIFTDQAIHGVTVSVRKDATQTIAVWGGYCVRFLQVDSPYSVASLERPLFTRVVKVSDWILHLEFNPLAPEDVEAHESAGGSSVRGSDTPRGSSIAAAAVTAHNELVEFTVCLQSPVSEHTSSSDVVVRAPSLHEDTLTVHVVELTSSSRSILYSAHLRWESPDHILIAAGTAFGEIILWSWWRARASSSHHRAHQVFLGHEGSIFGVYISEGPDESKILAGPGFPSQRFLASCSDDRTVRIWDVTKFLQGEDDYDDTKETRRTRHTGFVNPAIDADDAPSSSRCAAIGWGHLSRVWSLQFLSLGGNNGSTSYLLSAGEDATTRLWHLVSGETASNLEENLSQQRLLHIASTAYHNGKNIWSTAVCYHLNRHLGVITGAADGAINYHTFPIRPKGPIGLGPVHEYTIQDISANEPARTDVQSATQRPISNKSSKMADFFRSYAFMGPSTSLLTTNTGKIYMESLDTTSESMGQISQHILIAEMEDLRGYSICCAEASLGVAFVAGSGGNVYALRQGSGGISQVHAVPGKVSSMFIAKAGQYDTSAFQLLITLMGKRTAYLLCGEESNNDGVVVARVVELPLSELLTGTTITSMAFHSTGAYKGYVFLGFRGGAVAIYAVATDQNTKPDVSDHSKASFVRVIDKVHAKETVTSILWEPANPHSLSGHLISVGRDACLTIHSLDLERNDMTLVHRLSLPFGPNIECVYKHHGQLIVYGFSSTKFVHYNTATEEEIMNAETGGSHRSWAFQSNAAKEGGGTLIWTRASSMHIYTQEGPNHQVIRAGGHGREIKSVAVSPTSEAGVTRRLIATGAEDTDIKIYEYDGINITCRRTLRKHTTGIQDLKWSENGEHLFSSGGCEEFYVWRISRLPSPMGIGVLCESVCAPESEHSDLRIMSFDVQERSATGTGYIIAMVYSDSTVRVYSYDPSAAVKWSTLAQGTYFTSCLTQCIFLSANTILTSGTDGHAVIWPVLPETYRPHISSPVPPAVLTWDQPARIHQSTSKTLNSAVLDSGRMLVVSGGDDESLTFLLTRSSGESQPGMGRSYIYPPVNVVRTHASAVTACAIFLQNERVYVLSSGNDQWLRLWEVVVDTPDNTASRKESAFSKSSEARDHLSIKRIGKTRSNVADISSMAVLLQGESSTRVLTCGVGMEVIHIDTKLNISKGA